MFEIDEETEKMLSARPYLSEQAIASLENELKAVLQRKFYLTEPSKIQQANLHIERITHDLAQYATQIEWENDYLFKLKR